MLSASQQQLVVHNCRLVSNYADSTPPAKINEYFRKSTKNSSTCAGQQLNKRKAPHFSCSTYRAFSLSLSYTNKHSHTHTHTHPGYKQHPFNCQPLCPFACYAHTKKLINKRASHKRNCSHTAATN